MKSSRVMLSVSVFVGFRQSHIRDGAALARYFAWLEEQLNNGVVLNESEGADQLEMYRSYVNIDMLYTDPPRIDFHHDLPSIRELDHFKGLSFDTISATGPNGGECRVSAAYTRWLTHLYFVAVIHYKPDPADCAIIRKDQVCVPHQDSQRCMPFNVAYIDLPLRFWRPVPRRNDGCHTNMGAHCAETIRIDVGTDCACLFFSISASRPRRRSGHLREYCKATSPSTQQYSRTAPQASTLFHFGPGSSTQPHHVVGYIM